MRERWRLGEVLRWVAAMIASHGAVWNRIVGHVGVYRWVSGDKVRAVRGGTVLPMTASGTHTILMMVLRLLRHGRRALGWGECT